MLLGRPRGGTAYIEAGAETKLSQGNKVGCHSSHGEDTRLIQDGAIGKLKLGSYNFSGGKEILK